MLVGILKDRINNIDSYLYYDFKIKKFFGYSVTDSGITQNINVLNLFLKKILINENCKYVKKYKEYDVYLDVKENLFHFIKNNKEDYNMFIKINGREANLYKKKNNIDYKLHISKKEHKQTLIITTTCSLVLSLVLSIIIPEIGPALNDISTPGFSNLVLEDIYEDQYNISKILGIDYGKLTYEDAIRYIKTSKSISENERAFLLNEDFLKDIFELYKDSKMEYIINQRLKNIAVKSYSKEENTGTLGYWNSFFPNTLNLLKDIKADSDDYYNVLSHEYVHLCQANRELYLITESSAEIISHEYFGVKENSYMSACVFLKILIDVVGPKPVLDLIFKDDSMQLFNILKNNLSKDSYKSILLFISQRPEKLKSSDYNKANDIIAELYENIYGTSIYDNRNIYMPTDDGDYSYIVKKAYFNVRNMEEGKRVIKTDVLEGLISKGEITGEIVHQYGEEIGKEEYSANITSPNVCFVPLNKYSFYSKSEDGKDLYTIEVDGETKIATLDEILKNNYVKYKYYRIYSISKEKKDYIDGHPYINSRTNYTSKKEDLQISYVGGVNCYQVVPISLRFKNQFSHDKTLA